MTAPSMAPASIESCQPPNARMLQNFHLVWLDGSIDEVHNDDCRNSITKLRQAVNTINVFTDVDRCIDFITDTKEDKTLMVVSGTFSRMIIPVIQDISQVNVIYIFCENQMRCEKWAKEWPKVKGVYTDVVSLCEAVNQAAKECDQNSVSISFVKSTDGTSKENLDQLDSSFMYTQILKEILLTINFEQEHIDGFLTYCREQFVGNTIELRNVDKIEREYHDHRPIWWYTYQCFLYSMLNRALRTMEVDLIITMGFFVRDLHQHILALHSEQYGRQNHSDSFIVYRGQGLPQIDFEQLMKTQDVLLSFNNFLSTSKNRDVSLRFLRRTVTTTDLVGVLFIFKVDPSRSTIPFANVRNVSYYQGEEEILFSMHSVFRIGQLKQIDGENRLYQVELTLTDDKDPQLHALTDSIRKETFPTYKGWYRLGKLMMKVGQFNKAQELYEILLKQTTDEVGKGNIYHMLGQTKFLQGEYGETVTYYEKALQIHKKVLPENHPDLAISYNNIGMMHHTMREHWKALLYYEKALKIYQKSIPTNHPDLATSYNNIGGIYDNMGEHSKALSYFEKDIAICQKTLPVNHPDLATSYNNIGGVYESMGEHSKALSYFEKALEICQKTLLENHPFLATSCNNIGLVYGKMGEYSTALSYCERALFIKQLSLPPNHPSIKNAKKIIELLRRKL